MQKCLVTVLLCLISVYVRAQYQVTGKVIDQSGETLIGATVREVGNVSNGTITDFNGEYAIQVTNRNAQLLVQYVGYEDAKVEVNGKQKVDVVLKTSTETLEEVVVVGYGTQKKASVTGAITSVNQKILKQTPVANISNALVGKVTGLTAIQSSGEPGYDGATIFVRGKASFTGNTAPLILKDIKNADGTQLFPQTYDKELWKKAADAAQAAIDRCLSAGITLSHEGVNSINKYEKMFYNNTNNSEFILASIQTYGIYEDVSCNSHSNDKGGWGRFSIMQNQVDAYETATGHLPFLMDDEGCILYDENGTPTINPESDYKEDGFTHVDELWDGTTMQPCTNVYLDLNYSVVKDMGEYDLYNMYVNRDPRFYASLTFQGAKFRNATEGLQRCYHFAYWRNQEQYGPLWVDGYPNINTNNETGYGVRKYMNPEADIKNWIGTSSNYPLFRLSELYLIKAEALNEYYDTPNQEVYDAINQIRDRVDMPRLPLSDVAEDKTQIGMRKRIRNERRVELFFEGHRFWDVRRWMVGDRCFGIPNYRMNAQPSENELMAKAREMGKVSMTDYASDPAYSEQRVWDSREVGLAIYYKRTVDVNCVFSDKMYLFPIPQDDINKNGILVQNYGW